MKFMGEAGAAKIKLKENEELAYTEDTRNLRGSAFSLR